MGEEVRVGFDQCLGQGRGLGLHEKTNPLAPPRRGMAWQALAASSFGSTLQQNIGGCRWDLDKDMGGAVLLLQLAAGLPQESRMRKKAASTVLYCRVVSGSCPSV